jgi:hypothetical protein
MQEGLTEDSLADEHAEGHLGERLVEDLPESAVRVASLALGLEAVGAVDHPGLVVAAQHDERLRVLDLVAEEERRRLDRLLASVDVVWKR